MNTNTEPTLQDQELLTEKVDTNEWAAIKQKATQHDAAATASEIERKVNLQLAQDSALPATDRIKAVGNAIACGAKEMVESGKKIWEEFNADQIKDAITDPKNNPLNNPPPDSNVNNPK